VHHTRKNTVRRTVIGQGLREAGSAPAGVPAYKLIEGAMVWNMSIA
jgi:hypothetical protein